MTMTLEQLHDWITRLPEPFQPVKRQTDAIEAAIRERDRLRGTPAAEGGGVRAMSRLFFVYGTLKRGFPNHFFLKSPNVKFLGVAHTNDFSWDMYSLGPYPCIVPNPNGHTRILGELYEVDEETMKDLDALEGYPEYYNRSTVGVFCQGDKTAWIYHMRSKPAGAKQILTGEW